MDFYFDLSLIQSQKIILTPQLKQAIDILKMNTQELSEYILKEMETNPALEIGASVSDNQEDTLPSFVEESEGDSYYGDGQTAEESMDDLNSSVTDDNTIGLSLKDHLLLQLHTSKTNVRDIEIAEYLIDNIDDNGYLAIKLNEAADFLNIPINRAQRILKLLQSFDPPGIGARNLKECLLIQLNQMEISDKYVLDIVQNHLDKLADNKIVQVAKEMGLSVKKVVEVLELVKTLEPRPGREFYSCSNTGFVIPDVIIKKIDDRFEVLINEESIPSINISGYYKKVLNEDINIEAKKFIQSKIDCVNWLIKCIQQRKNTLLRVCELIAKNQIDFFNNGRGGIRPLTMKKIAAELDIHESTVSRTVSGKFLQCTWGVFDLKYFFPARFSTSSSKETTSNNVKVRIESIIMSEDKKHPLSDIAISERLKDEGIEISRRTVAKYRSDLSIPSSSKRKKY